MRRTSPRRMNRVRTHLQRREARLFDPCGHAGGAGPPQGHDPEERRPAVQASASTGGPQMSRCADGASRAISRQAAAIRKCLLHGVATEGNEEKLIGQAKGRASGLTVTASGPRAIDPVGDGENHLARHSSISSEILLPHEFTHRDDAGELGARSKVASRSARTRCAAGSAPWRGSRSRGRSQRPVQPRHESRATSDAQSPWRGTPSAMSCVDRIRRSPPRCSSTRRRIPPAILRCPPREAPRSVCRPQASVARERRRTRPCRGIERFGYQEPSRSDRG